MFVGSQLPPVDLRGDQPVEIPRSPQPGSYTQHAMPLSDATFERVVERVVDDLTERFPSAGREAVAAVVHAERARLEVGHKHPEFLPSLIEHSAREILTERFGAASPMAV